MAGLTPSPIPGAPSSRRRFGSNLGGRKAGKPKDFGLRPSPLRHHPHRTAHHLAQQIALLFRSEALGADFIGAVDENAEFVFQAQEGYLIHALDVASIQGVRDAQEGGHPSNPLPIRRREIHEGFMRIARQGLSMVARRQRHAGDRLG